MKKKVNYKCVNVYREDYISSSQSYLILSPGLPDGFFFGSRMNLEDVDQEYITRKISSSNCNNLHLLRQYLEAKTGMGLDSAYFNVGNFRFVAFFENSIFKKSNDFLKVVLPKLYQSAEFLKSFKSFAYWCQVEKLSNSFLRALLKKDPYTYGHTKRVGILCRDIAKELGLNSYDVNVCYYSGLLHDIGKIGIQDSILKKKAALKDSEYTTMKEHPVISESMLHGLLENKDIILGVKHHHEKFDGTGYPSCLKGEKIPLSARLIAVADTFDALISHRPYRKGIAPELALDVMKKFSGTQLDPSILKALTSFVQKSSMIKKTKKVA